MTFSKFFLGKLSKFAAVRIRSAFFKTFCFQWCVCVCAGVVLPPGTRTVAGPEAAPAPSSDQAHGEENTPGAASESFLPLQSAALSKLRTSHCIQRKFNLMRLQHLCMERCGNQDDVELVYSYSLRKISGNKCSCSLRDKD